MGVAAVELDLVAESMIDRQLRVASRVVIAERTVALTLQDPDGLELPAWVPGAHIDLILGEESDGDPLVRQFSLCSDPDDRSSWRIAVLLEESGRGGSKLVHDSLVEGSEVRVRGPRNAFPLGSAERYVFVAGGIGITPLLPMIRRTAASGVAEWDAVYVVRSRDRVCFGEELAGFGHLQIHVGDEQGRLDLARLVAGCDATTDVYACGPPALLDALVEAHRHASWNLHVERFAAVPTVAHEERAFEVELASTGQVLTVAADETILQVLRREGLPVEWSCKEGVCGTCETDVLSGTPDHRDSVLTDEEHAEGDTMMICCSRAFGERIVLDL